MPHLRELKSGRLNLSLLATAIDRECESRGYSLRQAAMGLGLVPSTLTRIRHGKRPDAEALAVLLAWTRMSPESLLQPDDPARNGADRLAPAPAQGPPSRNRSMSRRPKPRQTLDQLDREEIDDLPASRAPRRAAAREAGMEPSL